MEFKRKQYRLFEKKGPQYYLKTVLLNHHVFELISQRN
ncbi:hypothetical protein MuYL_4787 [Mucilaginibacter xinganensis]|uniref:Uncharacterized protein n=1 Tax=Mucilaginibacter xinganensis TaxID=1234841 RepID=A0A223P3P8_9SPHI|nr:hypothetical protein MuYL_4787 [Mucilaginibacter xinganensis]